MQWHSEEAASARYEKIARSATFRGKMVLDVGCGFGDIIPFIRRESVDFYYTGVDIVPEFIEEARKKYPQGKFIQRDYFSAPLEEVFDIVICNGALSSNMGTNEENLSFRQGAIKTMFEHTKDTLKCDVCMYPGSNDPFGIIIEIKTGNPTQQVLEEALVQAEQYSSALRVKGGWTKPFKSIVLKQSGNKLQFSLGDETLRNDELIKRLESIEIPRP